MKKSVIILVFIVLICKCNDSGSSSKSAKGLKLNPDTMTADDKYMLPTTANTIPFDGANVPVTYTIIYADTVNEIAYVGIAATDANQTFNLKIYFPAAEIPAGSKTIDSSNSTVKVIIKVISGGETYTYTYKWSSGSLTFNSFTAIPVTTENEKSYTTYTISLSGTVTLVNINQSTDTKQLIFPADSIITARLVSSNDSSRK